MHAHTRPRARRPARLPRCHGDPAVAEAFFARDGGAYGTLPHGLELASVVERHTPGS